MKELPMIKQILPLFLIITSAHAGYYRPCFDENGIFTLDQVGKNTTIPILYWNEQLHTYQLWTKEQHPIVSEEQEESATQKSEAVLTAHRLQQFRELNRQNKYHLNFKQVPSEISEQILELYRSGKYFEPFIEEVD